MAALSASILITNHHRSIYKPVTSECTFVRVMEWRGEGRLSGEDYQHTGVNSSSK